MYSLLEVDPFTDKIVRFDLSVRCRLHAFANLLEIPVLGHLCNSQSQAHPLIRACCLHGIEDNLKGTLSGSISVGSGEQGIMDGQKVGNRVCD